MSKTPTRAMRGNLAKAGVLLGMTAVALLLAPWSADAVKTTPSSSNWALTNSMDGIAVYYGFLSYGQSAGVGPDCRTDVKKQEGDTVTVTLLASTISGGQIDRTITLKSTSTKTRILSGATLNHYVEVSLCEGCGCTGKSWKITFTSSAN
jgi:hypothetical protein